MKVRVHNLSGGVLVIPGIGDLTCGEERVAFVAEPDQHLVISNLETGRISGKIAYSLVSEDTDDFTATRASEDVEVGLFVIASGVGVDLPGVVTRGTPILGVVIARDGETVTVRRRGPARVNFLMQPGNFAPFTAGADGVATRDEGAEACWLVGSVVGASAVGFNDVNVNCVCPVFLAAPA